MLIRMLCMLFTLGFLSTDAFTQSKKQSSSLLWKVSGKQLKSPSYIFGTFHMMCKEDFTITPTLSGALAKTEQFYGELDMDDPNLQSSMLPLSQLSNTTLQTLIGEKDFKAVADSFQRITGMPLLMFNGFKPFMGLSLLAMNTIPCSNKIQPETEFVKLAKAQELPILGLETVADQMAAIDTEPLDSQVVSLKKTILNYDSVKLMMTKMINVYKQKDVEKLYQFIKNNGGTDAFETALLVKRNQKWVPLMAKAMQDKPSFFAVGAGHLGGANGVIALLRKQGYQVTPVLY